MSYDVKILKNKGMFCHMSCFNKERKRTNVDKIFEEKIYINIFYLFSSTPVAYSSFIKMKIEYEVIYMSNKLKHIFACLSHIIEDMNESDVDRGKNQV